MRTEQLISTSCGTASSLLAVAGSLLLRVSTAWHTTTCKLGSVAVVRIRLQTCLNHSLENLLAPLELSPDAEKSAKRLLEDPRILTKFINLAQGSGIAGEANLLKTLYLIVTSRLVKNHRLHARLSEEAAGGKSKLVGFILPLMPDSEKLDLGGGATKRALQYFDDLSRKIIFIDEADNLDPDLRAMLRKAVTEANVSRLVTHGDPASGFESKLRTVVTDGMVLIQAGTQVVSDPADETRFLMLSPDTSPEQTQRILDAQSPASLRAAGSP